jgi:hypothetical protein
LGELPAFCFYEVLGMLLAIARKRGTENASAEDAKESKKTASKKEQTNHSTEPGCYWQPGTTRNHA